MYNVLSHVSHYWAQVRRIDWVLVIAGVVTIGLQNVMPFGLHGCSSRDLDYIRREWSDQGIRAPVANDVVGVDVFNGLEQG